MQGDHLPNPQRFQVFTQLANGKGFRIKNSKYIYLFDKYGGFYDEYNNYYNADGEPEEAPSDQDEDFQKVVLEQDYEEHDDYDYYDEQYGGYGHDDHEDHYDSHHIQHQKVLQAISHNQAILHQYPIKTPLRVDFDNVSFQATKQDLLKHFKSKVGSGLLNVILTKQNGKFNGKGYFVCQQVSTAEKLIKYEEQQVFGRKIYFDVEPVDECLADPVTKQQMDLPTNIKEEQFESLIKPSSKAEETKDETKNPKKKYFSKNQVQNIKKQQPKSETPKVTEKKPQEPKKQEVKAPTWSKYYGQVTMFPQKTSFQNWMKSLGFQKDQHFKNLERAQPKNETKKFATVELRSDVFEKIEGKLYENVKVHFQKQK